MMIRKLGVTRTGTCARECRAGRVKPRCFAGPSVSRGACAAANWRMSANKPHLRSTAPTQTAVPGCKRCCCARRVNLAGRAQYCSSESRRRCPERRSSRGRVARRAPLRTLGDNARVGVSSSGKGACEAKNEIRMRLRGAGRIGARTGECELLGQGLV